MKKLNSLFRSFITFHFRILQSILFIAFFIKSNIKKDKIRLLILGVSPFHWTIDIVKVFISFSRIWYVRKFQG